MHRELQVCIAAVEPKDVVLRCTAQYESSSVQRSSDLVQTVQIPRGEQPALRLGIESVELGG